jgi:SAM-dependent methyltransferase
MADVGDAGTLMATTLRPSVLLPPPGQQTLPEFEGGWRRQDGTLDPFLSYVEEDHAVNWSEELEALHEESSRRHFIDVWTRRAMIARLGQLGDDCVIADVGCSTGYLLEDLQLAHPRATLVGVDLVGAGLRKAHTSVPVAHLVQADVCALPVGDARLDAVVSANVLEHVRDDQEALREIRRVLRPGARGVLVVPAGPGLYDYYDRFLGHERRYRRGELARKATDVGLDVIEDIHLGSLIFPAFWLVKKRNRRLYDALRGAALEARVAGDIARTRDSRLGHLASAAERRLLTWGVRAPLGIRSLVVVRRPAHD